MNDLEKSSLDRGTEQILDVERLRTRLPIDGLGSMLLYAQCMDSTNQQALTMLEERAGHGTLVVAEQQTEGRGRAGRRWVTRAGKGLAFSLILDPTRLDSNTIGLLPGLGAIAVTEALLPMGLKAEVKWPNDVLLSGRKIAGVLVENVWMGSRLEGSVLGIGVNLRLGAAPSESQLDLPAIDLESTLGYRVDGTDYLLAVLRALADWWARLRSPAFLRVWNERLAYRGRNVIVGDLQNQLHGRLEAVDGDGRLVLRSEDGSHLSIGVGDVHLRSQDEDFQTG